MGVLLYHQKNGGSKSHHRFQPPSLQVSQDWFFHDFKRKKNTSDEQSSKPVARDISWKAGNLPWSLHGVAGGIYSYIGFLSTNHLNSDQNWHSMKYSLVTRDPHNGLFYSLCNWVVYIIPIHPLYNPPNSGEIFHCSDTSSPKNSTTKIHRPSCCFLGESNSTKKTSANWDGWFFGINGPLFFWSLVHQVRFQQPKSTSIRS